jgi:fermentation-respiration switch protein FrsA (DUF1100 family)
MSSPKVRWSLLGAVFIAVLLAAGCAQLSVKEREMVFRVEPGTARWFSALPEGVQEIDIPVAASNAAARSDSSSTPGDKPPHIHAWWWPAADAKAPAILYLHGARWNLTGHLFRIEQLRAFGFSVLAIDYRGFGKSAGDLPSEATVYEDAFAAWQRLVMLQPDASRRFIYGHSLGGSVAVDLAARLKAAGDGGQAARGLIIESSFTTLADIARSLTTDLLPTGLILSQKFDTLGKIPGVGLPVLVVHGKEDRYVPPRFSEELYAAAQGPKKLLLIEGGTHNNSMRTGSDAYRQALADLFGLDAKGEHVGIVQR